MLKNKLLLTALFAAMTACVHAQRNTTENRLALRPDLSDDSAKSVLTVADQLPQFDGDWSGFLRNNLHFPQQIIESAKGNVNERIVVRFIVCEDGGICNLKVVQGSKKYPLLEKEAVRVISQSPPWKPGEVKGRKVKVYYTQPITFRLQ